MKRRNFIRLVGGGVLLATAGVGLSGCASLADSEVATEAWRGPANLRDRHLRWLGNALLAPSPHNMQPWLVDIDGGRDEVVIYVDRQRLLPATDPYARQIVIGHGTFIELLVMAANADGYMAEVALFPDGEFSAHEIDDRPLARLTFRHSATTTGDPLFSQVLNRHTTKTPFDTGRPIPPAVLDGIIAAARRPGIEAAGTLDADIVGKLRKRAAAAWRTEQLTTPAIMENQRLTRVGQREIAAHRDGIAVTGIVPELAAALGLFRRDVPPAPGSAAAERMQAAVEEQANTAMGWVWLTTRGNSRARQVESGRAFVRMQLAAAEARISLHPMSQALQEYAEMRAHFIGLHEDLGTDPRTQTIQMWARIGYGHAAAPTPRRALTDLVRRIS